MRRICMLFVMLVAAVGLTAADAPNKLVVRLLTGETVGFALASAPKLTFADAQLVINSEGCEVAYPLAQIDRYYFESASTNGIDAAPTRTDATIAVGADAISISGLPAGTHVGVYTTAGVLVSTRKADAAGAANIGLADMPGGVYIVKYGKSSTKIRKP